MSGFPGDKFATAGPLRLPDQERLGERRKLFRDALCVSQDGRDDIRLGVCVVLRRRPVLLG